MEGFYILPIVSESPPSLLAPEYIREEFSGIGQLWIIENSGQYYVLSQVKDGIDEWVTDTVIDGNPSIIKVKFK